MTTRLYSTNSLAGLLRSSTAVVDGDTSAGKFASGYVANAIKLNSNGDYFDTPPFLDGSASVTTLNHRFDLWGTLSASTNGAWIEFINSSAVVVARLKLDFGGATTTIMRFQQWTGATYNETTFSFTNLGNALRTFVVKMICGASGTCEFYVGGSLLTSFAINQAAVNNIARVRTYWAGGATSYYSQIMGADYDIRDAHFMVPAITGDSATNTGGTGTYADIAEAVLDETTNNVLSVVGSKKGQTHAGITVPVGYSIAGMVINARGRVTGGTVSDGKLGVKSGSSSVSSSGRAYNGGYEPRGAFIATDPATSGAFSQTAFNAAETYLEAA